MLGDFLNSALALLDLTSRWELLAVALALAYLVLAVKRSLWCWLCGFLSSAIYVPLTFEWRFYMEAALNVFYVAMSVYGYLQWRKGRDASGEVVVTQWSLHTHAFVIIGVLLIAAANGWIMSKTDAVYPYIDAFITWGSVVTTWMVARRVMENWLYWLVVDSVGAGIYFFRGRVATGILFVIYVCVVVRGYYVWRRDMQLERSALNAVPQE